MLQFLGRFKPILQSCLIIEAFAKNRGGELVCVLIREQFTWKQRYRRITLPPQK